MKIYSSLILVLSYYFCFHFRKEIKNLKHLQHREINNIRASLDCWKCPSCQYSGAVSNGDQTKFMVQSRGEAESQDERIQLLPIGYISTGFVRKRAVPRQPNLNLNCHGKISLCDFVFSNPEHSLEGLDGFSHMWYV